jgi:hypothetical protein
MVWSHIVPGMTDDTINLTRKPTGPSPADIKPIKAKSKVDTWQVRTLPRSAGGGFGLYYNAYEKADRHWYGEGGYHAVAPEAAFRYPTTELAAKKRDRLNK